LVNFVGQLSCEYSFKLYLGCEGLAALVKDLYSGFAGSHLVRLDVFVEAPESTMPQQAQLAP
jgi:hypothetical protein